MDYYKQSGFASIELITALAVMIILASIVVPRGVAVIAQAGEVAQLAAQHEAQIKILRSVIHHGYKSRYAITPNNKDHKKEKEND